MEKDYFYICKQNLTDEYNLLKMTYSANHFGKDEEKTSFISFNDAMRLFKNVHDYDNIIYDFGDKHYRASLHKIYNKDGDFIDLEK